MDFWLSRDEVRELDRRAIDGYGVPGIVLMENAGRGCAELLMRLNPERKPTVILCGPGNNGGDGFVIARHLDNHGWPVKVWYVVKDDKAHTGELATNYQIAARSGVWVRHTWGIAFPDKSYVADVTLARVWIVDAMFGTGLSRALMSPYDEVVAAVNASGNPVLAVDIPSGLDCDSGEPLGPTVRATHTA
ncbi:MAG TPA: NAD(P)H-hydrate epimerase, partial [Fimbriiglobus sp.]|nr:NAD(P)H-hydrate epimerase [Fimbriiglobus sp.]